MSSLTYIRAMMTRLCAPAGISFSVSSVCRPGNFDFDAEEAAENLVGEERVIYQNLRSPKRRGEFVAGRMAAKQTVAAGTFSMGAEDLEIGRDASGAPKIRGRNGVHLSISHADAFAVAVAAPFPVGVDLECNAPRPSSLLRYFYSDNERRLLNAVKFSGRERVVNQLWTRKEAAAKVGGWGGTLLFREVDCIGRTVTIQGETLVLRSGSTRGYVASIAFKKDGSNG